MASENDIDVQVKEALARLEIIMSRAGNLATFGNPRERTEAYRELDSIREHVFAVASFVRADPRRLATPEGIAAATREQLRGMARRGEKLHDLLMQCDTELKGLRSGVWAVDALLEEDPGAPEGEPRSTGASMGPERPGE